MLSDQSSTCTLSEEEAAEVLDFALVRPEAHQAYHVHKEGKEMLVSKGVPSSKLPQRLPAAATASCSARVTLVLDPLYATRMLPGLSSWGVTLGTAVPDVHA